MTIMGGLFGGSAATREHMHSLELELAHAGTIRHPTTRVLDVGENWRLLVTGRMLYIVLMVLHDLTENDSVAFGKVG